MKRIYCFLVTVELMIGMPVIAQTFSFDGRNREAILVKPTDVFTVETGYGYDFQEIITEARKSQNDTYRLTDGIFYFSVKVCRMATIG